MESLHFIVMQHCEVCGRSTQKLTKISIEGVHLLACDECRSLGEIVIEKTKPKLSAPILPIGRLVRKTSSRPMIKEGIPPKRKDGFEDLSIVKNYGALIKRAREALQLTPDELGRRIGEKASVIRKLEVERLVPDHTLAKKLEHILKVKLLIPSSETLEIEGLKAKIEGKAETESSLTLEDIAKVKEKSKKNI
ncbi:TIGR00270 family protein [Candidatus Bathyarchaeota archaeon]|nr:TIGR00270 family protein [Candidatus Bathyarchaeota archaeon]